MLALQDCFSILHSGTPTPEHVAHYTSLRVVQVETELRDLLTERTPQHETQHPVLGRPGTWAASRRGSAQRGGSGCY